MQDEAIKPGKFVTIIPETVEAMRLDRQGGATLKQISEKYQVSINTVRKYTDDIVKPRATQPQEINTEDDINNGVSKTVLEKHAGNILAYSKKKDAEVVAAGEAVQRHLAEKGINIDIDQIPPAQLIKLLKSPLGEDMNINVKGFFENWLEQQLATAKNPGTPTQPSPDKISFNDVKEIMMLKLFTKMTADDDTGSKGAVQEMRAENEKQRQFYEKRIENMEAKMRDMIFEKKIQTLDDKHTETISTLSGELEAIHEKIEQLRNIPAAATPAEKADAIAHIEQLAKDIERIKNALSPFGITVSAQTSAPSTPSNDMYQKPDGSTDYVRFIGDKIEGSLKAIAEAQAKKTPEQGEFVETPLPEKRPPTPEEYAEYLLSKPSPSPQEQQWLASYREELLRQQAKPWMQEYKPPEPERREATAPAEPIAPPAEQPEPPKPLEETLPVETPQEPKKDIVEQLQEQEAKQTKNLEGMI